MKILGLSGKARAGKDSVADLVCTMLNAEKVALADEIKRTAKRWFNFTDSQLWGDSQFRDERPPLRQDAPTARVACQQIGTEVARLLDRNVWINNLFDAVEQLSVEVPGRYYTYNKTKGVQMITGVSLPAPEVIVVPDVRYQNEMDAIKAKGGYLVRIYGDYSKEESTAGNHLSETEQDAIPDSFFHYVLHNDKGLNELYDKTADMLRELGLL